MKEVIICIGGPNNGEHVEVEYGLSYYRFAIPISASDMYLGVGDDFNETVAYKTADYRREYIADNNEKWPVLVYDKIDQGSLVKQMIDGYSND